MQATDITKDTLVGQVAAAAPLATRVFARHGIDFCCGGGVPLEEACTQRGLAPDTIIEELRAEVAAADCDVHSWEGAPASDLIDHILETYHRPLDEELPRIATMAEKVHEVHGAKDPQRLREMLDTVLALKAELGQHMMKEEQILFPMIRQGDTGMVAGPVRVMEYEHESAGAALRRLRELTNDYTPPEGACNTWRALWHALRDLERSLHEHIHLENNVLFPAALGR